MNFDILAGEVVQKSLHCFYLLWADSLLSMMEGRGGEGGGCCGGAEVVVVIVCVCVFFGLM